MNKKHCLILGIISIVLSLICILMSVFTKNNSDPLNINAHKESESGCISDFAIDL